MPAKVISRRTAHNSVVPEPGDLRSVVSVAAGESDFRAAFTEYLRAKAKIAALEAVAEEDYSEVEMTAAADEAGGSDLENDSVAGTDGIRGRVAGGSCPRAIHFQRMGRWAPPGYARRSDR